jgi:hypothetical protein
MGNHGAGAAAGADPLSDLFAADGEAAGGAAFKRRRFTPGPQRPVCDADRRDPGQRPEVHGQTGTAGMVTPSGVDQQKVRPATKSPDRGGQQGPFPER